jgi:hypothetical protein
LHAYAWSAFSARFPSDRAEKGMGMGYWPAFVALVVAAWALHELHKPP